jgi:hypothetical protein
MIQPTYSGRNKNSKLRVFESLPNEQRQLAGRLPLMRSQPETKPEVLKLVEEYDDTDELGPARGVVTAVMLSAPFWAAVIWFIWWLI